jgi:hypothetical protein
MPVLERCPRCGTPRRGDLQVCVRCETPFGTLDGEDVDLALPRPAAPSPTQSHGTVMVALLSGFVLLAFLLWLSVRGVGPFAATVVSSEQVGDTARVTVRVTNEGTKPGHGKCRIQRVSATGDQQAPFQFLSQRVPGKGSVTETVEVPLDPDVHTGAIAC